MTNGEKFREIFGDTNGCVMATEDWDKAEYRGPVHLTQREKFIKWLDKEPGVTYRLAENDGVYVHSVVNNEPIIRVSDFDRECGRVYIRWDGLTGYKSIDVVKEIIKKAERGAKGDPFGVDSLYESIFGKSGSFFAN